MIVADAAGHAATVERVPGEPPWVRRLGERVAVTNHLEGPHAQDPRNLRVRATTSSVARLARATELLAAAPPLTAERTVGLLRDRRGAGGSPLPLGDRRAIDALIATHGVVMSTTRRVLWVSESPHLLGRFVAFDLGRLLDPDYVPEADSRPLEAVPADPMLASGEWERLGRR